MTKKRIDIIDALRGLAVILMVCHHALYDLVVFLDAPEWFFSNPVLDFLHYIFAGLFIFLSGISSRFSHSNLKRGFKVIIVALVISAITFVIEMPIYFGILHFLGFSMVLYGLTRKFWDSIPIVLAPIVYTSLLIISAIAVQSIPIDAGFLWMFGWTYPGFHSADYFPIFPWLFLFLLGTWAGKFIVENRMPKWFYEAKIPVLPAVGKKSLLIYIVHQPVLYGIVMAIVYFTTI